MLSIFYTEKRQFQSRGLPNHRIDLIAQLIFLFFTIGAADAHASDSVDSDLPWTHVRFNDTDWADATQECMAPFSSCKKKKCGYHQFCYRMRLPRGVLHSFREPALSLGVINGADELYINGQLLGFTGQIDPTFVDGSFVYRLYDIPLESLSVNDGVMVSVRVQSPIFKHRFRAGQIALGEYESLLIDKHRSELNQKLFEVACLTFMALYLVSCLFLYINRGWNIEYATFGIALTLFGLFFVFKSLIFYETGLKNAVVQGLVTTLRTSVPASVALFCIRFHKLENTVWANMAIYPCFIFGVIGFFFYYFPPPLMRLFNALWMIALLYSSIVVVLVSFNALRRQKHESTAVFVGAVFFGAAAAYSVVGFSGAVDFTYAIFVGLSTLFFVSIQAGITSRHARLKRQLDKLSGQILNAQAEERKRLSRELHDGFGQTLHAIRLKLQMLATDLKGSAKETSKDLVELTSEAIAEVKEMALDLRPEFLENRPVGEIIAAYTEKMKLRYGINISFHQQCAGEVSSRFPPMITEHIYRFCQEALANAIKHANASEVVVRVCSDSPSFRIEVRDNGDGMDLKRVQSSSGLGIHTMQERAAVAGGTFRIETNPGKGTLVVLEVPVR